MGFNAPQRPLILLVEDDQADQELVRRAMRTEVQDADLKVVSDGEEALDYLLRRHTYAEPTASPRPQLVLLDLNLPRFSGTEILEKMKALDELKAIPVVMFSSSRQASEILSSYQLGCNTYVVKPVSFEGLLQVFRNIRSYWLKTASLPTVQTAR